MIRASYLGFVRYPTSVVGISKRPSLSTVLHSLSSAFEIHNFRTIFDTLGSLFHRIHGNWPLALLVEEGNCHILIRLPKIPFSLYCSNLDLRRFFVAGGSYLPMYLLRHSLTLVFRRWTE